MLKSAYLYFQNDEVHRVVNLGVRAVHRVTDTVGAGEPGRAAGAGVCLRRERPGRVALWAAGGRVLMQLQAAGAGEGAISEGGLRAERTFPVHRKPR